MAITYKKTTRWLLRKIEGINKVSDLDDGIGALADDIDATFIGLAVDTFAKRPPAGIPNRIFRASDTGAVYLDTGTEWQRLIRDLDMPVSGYASFSARGLVVAKNSTSWTQVGALQVEAQRYIPSAVLMVSARVMMQKVVGVGNGLVALVEPDGKAVATLAAKDQSAAMVRRIGQTGAPPELSVAAFLSNSESETAWDYAVSGAGRYADLLGAGKRMQPMGAFVPISLPEPMARTQVAEVKLWTAQETLADTVQTWDVEMRGFLLG